MHLNFTNLEKISNGELSQLMGGFSMSLAFDDPDDKDTGESNNCLGGNCAEGCGVTGNYNRFCSQNNVAGCAGG